MTPPARALRGQNKNVFGGQRNFALEGQTRMAFPAACAAANFKNNMLIMRYLRLYWSTFGLHFSCILHVDASQYFARIFIFLQDIRSFFAGIFIYVIKSVFIQSLIIGLLLNLVNNLVNILPDNFHCSCITYSGRGITPKAHSANFVCKVSDFF